MRNEELWKASKFVLTNQGLAASGDRGQVAPSSRFVADLAARAYEAAVRSHASGHLVDLGCGSVPLYGVYKEFVEEITCVDWADTLHPSLHIDVEADLAQPLPLQSSTYDTILVTDVLEHIPEPKNIFSEMARILKPGGKVIVGVPFFYWIHEEPHDYYRFTEFALQRLSSEAGLSVLSIAAYGGLPEIMADLCSKMIASLPGRLKVPVIQLQYLVAKYLRALAPVRRFSSATSARFPLGYVMIMRKSSDVSN